MEYTIIDLETFNKIKLYNVDDNFYNSKGEVIKKDSNCFLLNNGFLIPKENISDHILLISNKKNYLITKIMKNNKNYDSIFALDSKKAFEVYCYFKDKSNYVINLANNIIDDALYNLFKAWYYKFLKELYKEKKKIITSKIPNNYENHLDYILNQILLYCSDTECDSKIFYDEVICDFFDKQCGKLENIFDAETLLYIITKKVCNNMNIIKNLGDIEFDYNSIIRIFSNNIININDNDTNKKIKVKKKK